MDTKKSGGRSLDNKNTRFSKFKWGEDPKISDAIRELKEKYLPPDGPVKPNETP